MYVWPRSSMTFLRAVITNTFTAMMKAFFVLVVDTTEKRASSIRSNEKSDLQDGQASKMTLMNEALVI